MILFKDSEEHDQQEMDTTASVTTNAEIDLHSDESTTTKEAPAPKSKRGRPRKRSPKNMLLPGGVAKSTKKQKPPLVKRRNVQLTLDIPPTRAASMQHDDQIPSTPITQSHESVVLPTSRATPREKKKTSRYNTRAIALTTANVLYEDDIRANPEHVREFDSRGKLFMGSAKTSEEAVRSHRLFFNLGQNLYLDKQPDKTGTGEGSLRLSLWKNNAIDKLQRVGARFSITLNFDAIRQIKKEAEDIKMSLSLTDNEHFLGYCLTLGHQIYLTIEPDLCSVNLRKWYRPSVKKDDPEADLLPSREGIRLTYDQFKRFVEFLDSQLNSEFPSFVSHVFCCDRHDHIEAICNMCNAQGLLPMQQEFKRLLDQW